MKNKLIIIFFLTNIISPLFAAKFHFNTVFYLKYNADNSLSEWIKIDTNNLSTGSSITDSNNDIVYKILFKKEELVNFLDLTEELCIYFGKIEGSTQIIFNDNKIIDNSYI